MHESKELQREPLSTCRRENALNSPREIHGLTRTTILVVAALFLLSPVGFAAAQDKPVKSEQLLPPNTTGWVSVPDVRGLKTAIESSQFGAMMEVELVNSGPVTIMLDSPSERIQ